MLTVILTRRCFLWSWCVDTYVACTSLPQQQSEKGSIAKKLSQYTHYIKHCKYIIYTSNILQSLMFMHEPLWTEAKEGESWKAERTSCSTIILEIFPEHFIDSRFFSLSHCTCTGTDWILNSFIVPTIRFRSWGFLCVWRGGGVYLQNN